MGALVATTPSNTGTVTAGANVASSDTIAASVLGSRGAYLYIANASGSTDNVVISDAGTTGAGNGLPSGLLPLDAVATGTAQIYWIHPEQVNPATGLVTITHSQTTSVTYQLWPLGI